MKRLVTYIITIIISITFISCNNSANKSSISEESLNTIENDLEQDSSLEEEENNNVNNSEVAESITTDNKEQGNNEQANKDEDNKSVDNQTEKKSDENSKKVIVIDPGHASHSNLENEEQSPGTGIMKIKDGGGAQGNTTGTPEYVVNMSVAMKLKSLLEAQNYTVIMTKTSNDVSLGNIERANIGNDNNAALVIRIHCDSAETSSASGASMLVPAKVGYAQNISDISKKYGEIVLDSMVETAKMKNRGISVHDDMTGFNWSKVPVILVEMGFMSNPQEDKLLSDDNYQNKLAQGLCNGIVRCFT